VIWTGIEAEEPAEEVGSVALLVKTSGVWAWAEVRAAAIAKRKRKIRRMVVGEMIGRNLRMKHFLLANLKL